MSISTRLMLCFATCIVGMATHAEPQTKPRPLTRTTAFPEQFRDAVRAVARYVGSPQDFFAEIEPQKDGRELVLHLWHKSAFTPENIGAAGNPGGKCAMLCMTRKSTGSRRPDGGSDPCSLTYLGDSVRDPPSLALAMRRFSSASGKSGCKRNASSNCAIALGTLPSRIKIFPR
jgi:hypothetical protein